MPYASKAQEKYFNVNKKKMEAQGVNVDEWNAASKGLTLPDHAQKMNHNGAADKGVMKKHQAQKRIIPAVSKSGGKGRAQG